MRQEIDAFFAKKVDDHGIDVHAEGQLMMRTVMNPGSGWVCNVHPQPTFQDFSTSITTTRRRNSLILHLAGHNKKRCGFLWNGDDAATTSQTFDMHAVALAIASVAGKNGPLECAMLNGCSTEEMARLLRQLGVPCVVCWRTPVQDETARELCALFYGALVEDTSGVRDYKRAFFAATDKLRLSAHTGGAARGQRDSDGSVSSDYVGSSGLRNEGGDADMLRPQRDDAPLEQTRMTSAAGGVPGEGNGSSTRGKEKPWQWEDVVLFLSEDGDSAPIYLWRARPVPPAAPASTPQPAPCAAALDPALKSLLEQQGVGGLQRLLECHARDKDEHEIWMEQVSRFTAAEMGNTWDELVEQELTRRESMVCHYTDIDSAKLIIAPGSPGFRASSGGQGGGGFYVVTKGPHELGWEREQGGDFRGTVGRELWGEKAGDVREGGRDAAKLDVVFLIKIPTAWLTAAGRVPGRDAIKILPRDFLYQRGNHFYLQKERIVKGYILKKDVPGFCSRGSVL